MMQPIKSANYKGEDPQTVNASDEHPVQLVGLRQGRATCPKCKRKGLRYASHPHAQGWRDYERAVCRFCHARFRLRGVS